MDNGNKYQRLTIVFSNGKEVAVMVPVIAVEGERLSDLFIRKFTVTEPIPLPPNYHFEMI